jgi:hypothetical protein
MLLEVKKVIAQRIGEENISEQVSEKLINFVNDIESALRQPDKNWSSAIFVLFQKVVSLVFDLKALVPTLTPEDSEEIASKVFLYVYNNIIVPIDLPIPDYLEVLLERISEPLLDFVVRVAVRTVHQKVNEFIQK